jgi:cobalt/nickel transport protein
MRRRNLLLVAVALLAVAVAFGSLMVGAAGGGEFAGTDSTVSTLIEDSGYRPWAQPLTSLAPEVESGMFALQAGVGAGILGFALGTLRERRRVRSGERPR